MVQTMQAAFAAADQNINAELMRPAKTDKGEVLLSSGTVGCLVMLKGKEMILAIFCANVPDV